MKELIMQSVRLVSLALILTGVVGTASAQEPLTRAQVKAELAQAIKDGDVRAGDSSYTLAQVNP